MLEEYLNEIQGSKNHKDKLRKRITESIQLFEENGIITPSPVDYDNILRPYLSSKPGRGNNNLSTITIKEWIKQTQDFYKWKGDNQMPLENEINMTQETHENITQSENLQHEESNKQNEPQTNETVPELTKTENTSTGKGRAGRPVSTNRTDKFTLYMTPDTMKSIGIIASYDDITITDLLNNVLEDYIQTRQSDIAFVLDYERRKQERKNNK